MPRWCLFGRTRELCDKLESTGKAGQAKVEFFNLQSSTAALRPMT